MNLTPEQQAIGRRNFMKVAAGLPAVAGLAATAALKGPVRGGPVRLGFIGLGGEGRVLLEQTDPAYATVAALCDINPSMLAKSDDVLAKTKRPAAPHYANWQDMVQKEKLEAVVIAVPLWMHAEITVGCLDAKLHVLCEKMMAWDVGGCERMQQAAARNGRVLEIGYQRYSNPIYLAAYEGIIKPGLLGDVHCARLAWHRNGNWKRTGEPPSASYDPSRWGYPTWQHLLNWRLYNRYSRGLLAELASHQVSIANWFFGATPAAVMGTGGIQRFNDGVREVDDHVYAIFEYPGGRTATFSSIESNAWDHYYEAFFGTKGSLILRGEAEAYLFQEGAGPAPTSVEVSPKGGGPVLEASESRTADAAGTATAGSADRTDRLRAYRSEISTFCSAIRVGTPLACGAERAMHSAAACIRANEAVAQKARLELRAPSALTGVPAAPAARS